MDLLDETPRPASTTRVDRPSRRPSGAFRDESSASPVEVAETELVSQTVQDIVDRELHRRMQAFAPFVVVLIAVVGSSSLLLGGDPFARNVMLSTMLFGLLGSAWTLRQLRQRQRLSVRDLVVFGIACALPLNGAFYYWGVLSGVLVLMPLGAFVFPVGRSRPGLFAAASVLALHFVLGGLTILGVIEDRGLVRPFQLAPQGQWLSLLFADAIAIGSFFIGRHGEFSAERALLDLERATRAAAQRGELLAEARFDLARALHAGRAGRFTGQRVGSYTLGVVLGRGAMGEVYDAERNDGSRCAVKLLHLHLVTDRAHYARFVREARIAASLDVPNVVRVLDASDENAVLPFLVMERLTGVDLAVYLTRVPRVTAAEVLELVRQVGAGLDAAHAAGIVHRDLKPQNVFRAEAEGRVQWKVLDFGVSKLLEQSGTLSQGVVVGTPQYMAPEQARGDAVDFRADLYSLALIAYRALTGRPAFVINDARALLAVVLSRMPPRPSAVTAVPREVDDVFALAMAKEPSQRFDSGDRFAGALEAALEGRIAAELRERAQEVLVRWPWSDPARES